MRRLAATMPASRSAFTLIELLAATITTALVAVAATTMVTALGQASTQTQDTRAAKTQGHYALGRVNRTIREARGIGEVTSSSVTLWLADESADDKFNLKEAGIIRYNADLKQIVFECVDPAAAISSSLFTATADFVSATRLLGQLTGAGVKRTIWAEGVESCAFTGYPSSVETRYVTLRFTIGTGANAWTFEGSSSPRASADYLFYSETQSPPPLLSGRKVRKYWSRWTGFADVPNSGLLSILN